MPVSELAADPALLLEDRLLDRAQAHPPWGRHRQAVVIDLEPDRAAASPSKAEVAQLPAQHDPAQWCGDLVRRWPIRHLGLQRQAPLAVFGGRRHTAVSIAFGVV